MLLRILEELLWLGLCLPTAATLGRWPRCWCCLGFRFGSCLWASSTRSPSLGSRFRFGSCLGASSPSSPSPGSGTSTAGSGELRGHVANDRLLVQDSIKARLRNLRRIARVQNYTPKRSKNDNQSDAKTSQSATTFWKTIDFTSPGPLEHFWCAADSDFEDNLWGHS